MEAGDGEKREENINAIRKNNQKQKQYKAKQKQRGKSKSTLSIYK